MKIVRSGIAVAALLLLAQGAMAARSEGSTCEEQDSCGDGGGLDPLPNIPQFAVSRSAQFFAAPSDGWNTDIVQGLSYYDSAAHDFYIAQFGHGIGTPFTDSVHTFGSGNSVSTLQTFFAPNPTVAATAHQDSFHGRSSAGVQLGYLVTLVTPDSATADGIQALMGSTAFATVQGMRTLSASGYGISYGQAYSSYGPDGDTSYGSSAVCNDTDHASGCGTAAFAFNLGFRRGNEFADGNANYFYAVVNLAAEADAGLGNLGVWPGDSSAFVDPTITLSPLLTKSPYGSLLSLDIGGYGPLATAAGVPEPTSWGLMLAGFGIVGGALRRRHRVTFAA